MRRCSCYTTRYQSTVFETETEILSASAAFPDSFDSHIAVRRIDGWCSGLSDWLYLDQGHPQHYTTAV